MNIAIFKAGKTPEYYESVNGAEYMTDQANNDTTPTSPDVLITPDISAGKNVPVKFWKRVGDTVVEMDQADKDAIAAAELQARKDMANDFGVQDMKIILKVLIALLNRKLPANKQITKQEVVDALKGEIK